MVTCFLKHYLITLSISFCSLKETFRKFSSTMLRIEKYTRFALNAEELP